jgi:hypothetical protein
MGKILKTTLFTWLGSCLFLSSSCTVFYKTSDIDAKISASIQSANENCNGVLAQITAFQNDYRSLSCEAKSSPFDDALISMGEIDNSKLQMQALQSDIKKMYLEFKGYTKGKEKIASNTNEWKQFKTTKKGLKSKFKELQSEGEKTVKEAEKFNVFVLEQIVPLVKLVDVSAYIKTMDESQKSLFASQKDLDSKLEKLENDLTNLKLIKGKLSKDQFERLDKDFEAMQSQRNELTLVQSKLASTIIYFKQQIIGKTKVYSCSADWEVLNEAEKSFAEQQAAFNKIQVTIIELYAHMQEIIIEIK